MKDYGKGKIYTIRCRTDDTLIYVGSTVQPLSKRLGNHKADSKREKCKNYLIYKTINGDWNNWHIELHSLYPCNSKEELERKEGEIIRLIGNLNSKIAGRTPKEYREDNKEKVLKNLIGNYAIGHNRYSTTGENTLRNIQPFFADTNAGGLGIAHNGNLTNAEALSKEI